MKHFVSCVILLIVAYHASGQTDTTNKKIAVNDSLQNRANLFMNNLPVLSNGYYIHFRADSMQKNKSQSLFFYNCKIYKPTPCQNFWNTAGPLLLSVLAEQARH
jgi:hypothetical protein